MIDTDTELRARIALALRNAYEGGYAEELAELTDEELCDDMMDFDASIAEMAPRSAEGDPDLDALRELMLPHVKDLR